MRRIVVVIVSLLVATAGVVVASVLEDARSAHRPLWSPGVTASASPVGLDLPSATPAPTPTASPSPSMTYPTLRAPKHPGTVSVAGTTLFGWALIDTSTGRITGSTNDESTKNTVESMIKGWLAADFLRRQAHEGETPTKTQLKELTLMIIDSNNQIAQEYYNLGGRDSLMKRLISVCGLRSVTVKHNLWSYTEMTPADAARYGSCLADGRAAGPKWTAWLLDVMRKVRGEVDDQISDTKQGGRWGIIDGLPSSMRPALAMKNGWTQYVDGWHVDCLGMEQNWVLSIMIRTDSLRHAAGDCASVARQLVVTG